MFFFKRDPGECIVCGAAQCACGGAAIARPQTPCLDARARLALAADRIQATRPPGQVTTAMSRRARHGRARTNAGTARDDDGRMGVH